MQYLLPDEDSREKVAAESWSLKVDRLKEGTLAVRSHSCYQSGCERLPGLSGPSALLCMFGRAQQCAAFQAAFLYTGCMLCAHNYRRFKMVYLIPAPFAGP